MKKITNEIIAKIFSQYLGCQFLYSGTKDNSTTELDLYALKLMIEYNDFNKCTLLLTPLEQITDKDANEIALILGMEKWNQNDNFFVTHRRDDAIVFSTLGTTAILFFNGQIFPNYNDKIRTTNEHKESLMIIYVYQYLQSKGYALPYMNYSVDELVENGVIKLKTTII